jgi:ATP-dependent HslUV protease ATP-binding subunit HslU
MVRDLVELAIAMVREEHTDDVEDEAWDRVDERLLDLLLPPRPAPRATRPPPRLDPDRPAAKSTRASSAAACSRARLEEAVVEIEVLSRATPPPELMSQLPLDDVEQGLSDSPSRSPRAAAARSGADRRGARDPLPGRGGKLLDMDKVIAEALDRAENTGIVFPTRSTRWPRQEGDGRQAGPTCRASVQRDLLPIVEGTNVPTRYGMIKTDHVLFIASGAFHAAKPSDLLPELQGRFPIRVEMKSLTEDDFVRILTEPENALLKQYKALLKADDCKLSFDPAAVREIASIATRVNASAENIGARRLQTVLATLLEDVLFEVPNPKYKNVRITREEVRGPRPRSPTRTSRVTFSSAPPRTAASSRAARRLRAQPPPTGGPPDVSAPTLLATQPDSGAVHVARDAVVRLVFSETMDRASVGQNVVLGPGVRGVRAKWVNGRTLELQPDELLPENRTLTIIVPPEARDVRVNALDRVFTAHFTTGEAFAPGRSRERVGTA